MINKSFVLAYAAVWFSTALAVCVGLYFTRDVRCLFFMLIPTLIRVYTNEKTEEEGQ
jgi:hypothetical protein